MTVLELKKAISALSESDKETLFTQILHSELADRANKTGKPIKQFAAQFMAELTDEIQAKYVAGKFNVVAV